MTSARTSGPFGRRGSIAALLFGAAAIGAMPVHGAEGTASDSSAARVDYLLHCSGCHLPNGAGAPPEVPSLRGPIGAIVGTPAGRDYIARVPEAAQSPLDDAELARVLNWMLRAFSAETLPSGFRPLDAAEVGAARIRVLADPLRARAAIAGRYEGAERGDGRH